MKIWFVLATGLPDKLTQLVFANPLSFNLLEHDY